jgi:hypothetical protein
LWFFVGADFKPHSIISDSQFLVFGKMVMN